MQPPVMRKKIEKEIREAGRPLGVRELIERVCPGVDIDDRDEDYKAAYARIIQSCKLAASSGEFVKVAPGTFGIRGVAYYTKSIPAKRAISSGSVIIPRRKKQSAGVADLSSWVAKATRENGHD
jgi:hypothetical protein